MVDEMRYILLVAEHGTLTAAARHAHLSQPALSVALKRAEAYFGATLFERGRHGATLTAAGAALVPKLEAALAAIEDGRRAVEEVIDLKAGEVRVAAGATACTYLLPKYIAKFRRKYPEIRFHLKEAFGGELRRDVDAGVADLAIVSGRPGELLVRDELVVVGAPGRDSATAGFITFPEGSDTRRLLRKTIPGAEIVMEIASIAAVKANVRAGIGVALLSRIAVESDLRAKRLVIVKRPRTPIRRQLSLYHRGSERLTPAASAFRELIRKR